MKLVKLSLAVLILTLAAPGLSGADIYLIDDSDDSDSTDVVRIRVENRPVIAVHYGLSSLDHDEVDPSFAPHGALDIRLGYSKRKPLRFHDGLFEREEGYVFLETQTIDVAIEDAAVDELETESWRFGACFPSGYGYDLGDSDASIFLYHSGGLGWSTMDLQSSWELLPEERDSHYVHQFDDETRFGTTWEAGVRIAPTKMLALETGYQGALVFPRTQFWYFAFGTAVEAFALEAVNGFVDAISETSPHAVPIVHFLLANGVSYGFHELRKEKMHWPIDSAAPLTYDTVKFGISFTF